MRLLSRHPDAVHTGHIPPACICEQCAPSQRVGGSPDQARDLAEEVLAHLRSVAGADALLRAYNVARAAVQAQRTERRRQKAVQVLVRQDHHHAWPLVWAPGWLPGDSGHCCVALWGFA